MKRPGRMSDPRWVRVCALWEHLADDEKDIVVRILREIVNDPTPMTTESQDTPHAQQDRGGDPGSQ